MGAKLTVVFYTSNYIASEFAEAVQDNLLSVIGNLPLISVSQKPMDFGENICVGNTGRSHLNIYKQILIGAKAAKTDYVAMAEDDILYTEGHFTTFLPLSDVFAYNINRWGLYTWSRPPVFSYKNRIVINQMIAPRRLLVKAFEERFAKYPNPEDAPLEYWGEPGRYERQLKVTVHKTTTFASPLPSVVFSHEDAFGFAHLGIKKSLGVTTAASLPYWGSAEDVREIFKNRDQ